MEDGLQDTREERADRGFLEESFAGLFGLLSWVADLLQLTDFLGWHFLWAVCRLYSAQCQVHWTAQLGCVACLSTHGRSGSSAAGGRGRWVSVQHCPALSLMPSLSHPATMTAMGGDGAGSWNLVLVTKGWVQELVSIDRPGSCFLLSVSRELDLAFLQGGCVGFDVGFFYCRMKDSWDTS